MKNRRIDLALLLLASGWISVSAHAEGSCTGTGELREATRVVIEDFVADRQAKVLTFEGYSGSQYEVPEAMLDHATRILDAYEPESTLVNIGATAVGIGAVYEIAKRKGFTTMGIVSTLARDENVTLSSCVDHVFFVADSTWGGKLDQSGSLSPTSQAIVDVSDFLVAIGGGDVARDELLAARARGKPVTFIPADMNHAVARAKAARKNLPEPTDFRGSVHGVFGARD